MTAQLSSIGVGIVGASVERGWAALAHKPALDRVGGLQLRAVCARRQTTVDQTVRAWGLDLGFTDPRELAEHPDVDLVVVTVKVPDHFHLVSQALDAGKMVYCEWPLGRDLTEARDLEQRARDAGVRTMVGLQGRMSPATRYVRELVEQGAIGRPLSSTLRGHTPGGRWTGELEAYNAYQQHRASGATFLSIGVGHALDCFTRALGEFSTFSAVSQRRRPEKIMVAGEPAISDTTDEVVIAGQLTSGVVASVHYSAGTGLDHDVVWEIFGEEGTIVADIASGFLNIDAPRIRLQRHGEGTRELTPPAEHVGGHPGLNGASANITRLYQQFADDVRDGTHETPDFTDAVRRHELLDAIERSDEVGARVLLSEEHGYVPFEKPEA